MNSLDPRRTDAMKAVAKKPTVKIKTAQCCFMIYYKYIEQFLLIFLQARESNTACGVFRNKTFKTRQADFYLGGGLMPRALPLDRDIFFCALQTYFHRPELGRRRSPMKGLF